MRSKDYHHGDLKNALIKAGVEILSDEGVQGLSLRKVAKRAGVSHSAPYAHFQDKQALIAAIATEGHSQIYKKISEVLKKFPDDPERQLVESAMVYLDFGLNEPDLFRITFAGAVEQEDDHPELLEMAYANFEMICKLVAHCQSIGVMKDGSTVLMAQSLWSVVYGIIMLLLQGQVSHKVLDHNTPQNLLLFSLDQMISSDLIVKENNWNNQNTEK